MLNQKEESNMQDNIYILNVILISSKTEKWKQSAVKQKSKYK